MVETVDDATERLIRGAYEAFNRRDIGGALSAMTPDVKWANGWEGGYVRGHDAVRSYWMRQWQELDPTVTPRAMHVDDRERVVVDVEQEVQDVAGQLIGAGRVQHAYTLRDGLVARMEILNPEA